MTTLFLGLLVGALGQQVSTVFDDATAHELMQLRRQFDEAELRAIRAFDAAVRAPRVAIPLNQYRNQLATREVAKQHWTPDQKRRAAAAWPTRQKSIAEAEEILSTRTASILKRFGFKDDRIPPVRHRKWDGPAVYGFNGFRGDVPPDSRALLQELRRLWVISARHGSASARAR